MVPALTMPNITWKIPARIPANRNPSNDPIVENFILEPFDLLINLCMNYKTPLLYVTALSRAKFKVGKEHPKYTPYYDLMLSVDENLGLQSFITLAEKYLNMIHPKK